MVLFSLLFFNGRSEGLLTLALLQLANPPQWRPTVSNTEHPAEAINDSGDGGFSVADSVPYSEVDDCSRQALPTLSRDGSVPTVALS